jgi:hypothetical protein
MDVSEYFDGCVYSEHHGLFLKYFLALISQRNDVFPPECEVAIPIELGRPLSGSKQVVQKQGVQSVNRIHLFVLL